MWVNGFKFPWHIEDPSAVNEYVIKFFIASGVCQPVQNINRNDEALFKCTTFVSAKLYID